MNYAYWHEQCTKSILSILEQLVRELAPYELERVPDSGIPCLYSELWDLVKRKPHIAFMFDGSIFYGEDNGEDILMFAIEYGGHTYNICLPYEFFDEDVDMKYCIQRVFEESLESTSYRIPKDNDVALQYHMELKMQSSHGV